MKSKIDSEIEKLDRAYSEGDSAFFDSFAPDATVFRTDHAEPFASLKEFRAYFEPILKAGKRTVRPISRKIQHLDSKAIVSQVIEVTQNGVKLTARQTVVWSSEGDRWKIIHLHTAQFGKPAAPEAFLSAQILNERIATVAAVVGVAQ